MVLHAETATSVPSLGWEGHDIDPKLFFSRYNDASEADLARINHLSLLSCNPSGSTAFLWPRSWEPHFDASSGLLGIQAPAAEEPLFLTDSNPLLPPFKHRPQSQFLRPSLKPRSRKASIAKPTRIRKPTGPKLKPAKKLPLYIPNEIHLEIISHLLSTSPSSPTPCGICDLSQLAKLASVSRFHSALITPKLYSTLALDLRTSTSSSCCHAHTAKTTQLEHRIPLLLRTLTHRPALSNCIKKLKLPTHITHWLSCELEKNLLPKLLDLCPDIQEVTGLEGILERQFYSGEHYCLTNPQEHGILVQHVMSLKNLRRWKWEGGDTTPGERLWTRVFDQQQSMRNVDWPLMHQNWGNLAEITLQELTGITKVAVQEMFSYLPKVRKLRIDSIGRRVRGRLVVDSETMMKALSALPTEIRVLEIAGVSDDATFLHLFGQWLANWVAKGGILERLRIEKIALTSEGVRDVLEGLCTLREESGRRRWTSCVQRLEIMDSPLAEPVEEVFNCYPEWRELRGLKELVWEDVNGHLGSALVQGWFADLDGGSECVLQLLERRRCGWLRLV